MSSAREGSRLLVVDDDPSVTRSLQGILEQAGHTVATAADVDEALARLEREPFDAVVTDVQMPGRSGIQLVAEIRRRGDEPPVIVVTAFPTVESAVEAMRAGAFDYLQKPFQRDDLLDTVSRALVASRAAPGAAAPADDADLVARSAKMHELDALVRRVARTDATVLLTGETGVGKEVVARAIHRRSPRADGPFLKVHCAALPEALLESELFGYERGAFTGATTRKAGRFELAEGGTLLLDEVGELELSTQVKLLRVLQDGEFERIGGTRTLVANVRVVAATHRDLAAMRADGRFREDLFYRLNVFPIHVPALRERPEDLPDLARQLLARASTWAEGPVSLAEDGIAALVRYPWPGNVRELANLLERAVILKGSGALGGADLEPLLAAAGTVAARAADPSGSRPAAEPTSLSGAKAASEKGAIERALAQTGGNRTRAAKLLGISRRTLYAKLDEHGLA